MIPVMTAMRRVLALWRIAALACIGSACIGSAHAQTQIVTTPGSGTTAPAAGAIINSNFNFLYGLPANSLDASGTILGVTGGSPAYPAALTAIPTGVTADASLITTGSFSLALLPGSSVRYVAASSVALVSTDNGNVVSESYATAWTATLPQVGTSNITAGAFQLLLINTGAGAGTLTPTTSTINGGASITIAPGSWALIFADNSSSPGNYVAVAAGPAGVTCSGTPTSSFASVNGIVTHC